MNAGPHPPAQGDPMRPRLLSPTLLLISTAFAVNTANAATVPQAVDDSVVVHANTEATFNFLANDVAAAGPLAVISASTPAHGKVVLENGRVRYIPTAGYVGSDSFTYTIRDGLSIGAVDRSPLANFGSGASAATVFASGFGSALARVPGSTTDFYIMTDRGPNAGGTGTNKVFPVPTFAPQIARVTPNAIGGYRVVNIITFKRPTAAPALNVNGTSVTTLTGLPNTFNPTVASPSWLVAPPFRPLLMTMVSIAKAWLRWPTEPSGFLMNTVLIFVTSMPLEWSLNALRRPVSTSTAWSITAPTLCRKS